MSSESPRRMVLLTILICALIPLLTSCSGQQTNTVAAAPRVVSDANQPAEIDLQGVPNFHKVSDTLYRGAQPTKEGFKELEKSGIKTVVNLRAFHSDRDELKGTNLAHEDIGMVAFLADEKDVVKFLKIVTDPNRTPIFVHCQRGADRTGAMCAAYRVVVQDWPKDKAIEEMTKGDFKFNNLWQNLVTFIRKLDVEKIRQQVGIKTQAVKN
jgi:protein tyrosine phosphatase (PTP) superfamily phosphohydrolase (DUF442 family)